MVKLIQALRAAIGAAVMLCAIAFGGTAAAQGGIQIDTSAFGTQAVSLCTLGQACNTSYNLNFQMTLGAITFSRVYIYKEGVVGLGAELPLTAHVGSLESLGGAFIAPALSDFAGYDVSAAFAYSGGPDHLLPVGVNDSTLVNFFVNTHTTGNVADLPSDERGEFQIRFHTFDLGVGFGVPALNIGYGGPTLPGPNPGTAADLFWPGTGVPPGALSGTNFTGVAAAPEPAAWMLLIGGFFMMGAALRRRAAAPA